MKSVRLDEALEARLSEVARLMGKPVSAVIRDAIAAHCDAMLQERLDLRLADVVGVVESEGGRASATGKAFSQILQERRKAAGS